MARSKIVFTSATFLALLVGPIVFAEVNSAPYDPGSVPHEGIRYLLSRNRINVTITKTASKPVLIKEFIDPANSARNELKPILGVPADKSAVSLAADIDVAWEADPSKVYVLDLSPRAMSDAEVTVDSHPDGRLSSVNTQSTGQGGTVLSNIFKVVGTLVGLTTGPAFAAIPDASALAAFPPKTDCNVWIRPLSDLDNLTRITIEHSGVACDAWKDSQRYAVRAKAQRTEIERLEDQVSTIASAQLAALKTRITEAAAARDRTHFDRRTAIAVIEAQKSAFVDKWKIGENQQPPKTEELTFLIEELPMAGAAAIREGLTKVQTELALASYSVAKKLLAESEHVITVDSVPTGYQATEITQSSDGCKIQMWHGTPSNDKNVRKRTPTYDRCKGQLLFYKRPISTSVTLWKLEKGAGGAATLQIKEKRQLMLVRSESPLEVLEFSASAWSDGSLVVAFGDTGVPSKITWKSDSSAAAITGALAGALTAARTEYSATIAELVTIKENKAKLNPKGKSDVQKEIDELTKKKELIDARLAIEGAEATYESQLEQQRLAQQLALLNSEQSVVTAEQAATNQLDILRLAAELSRLNTEMQILKAQIDLDALRKPK